VRGEGGRVSYLCWGSLSTTQHSSIDFAVLHCAVRYRQFFSLFFFLFFFYLLLFSSDGCMHAPINLRVIYPRVRYPMRYTLERRRLVDFIIILTFLIHPTSFVRRMGKTSASRATHGTAGVCTARLIFNG